jgi:hypothetical protein
MWMLAPRSIKTFSSPNGVPNLVGSWTGEFGTVEQANEDDAVVKWDDDGRVRLHQPWLKKLVASDKAGPICKV